MSYIKHRKCGVLRVGKDEGYQEGGGKAESANDQKDLLPEAAARKSRMAMTLHTYVQIYIYMYIIYIVHRIQDVISILLNRSYLKSNPTLASACWPQKAV